MADKTKIQWTDASWNCIAGCTKCSPGCENCYAERMAWRLSCIELADCDYSPFTAADRKYYPVMYGGKWNGKINTIEKELDTPLHWRKPRRIFVNSMSDTFHKSVPFEFIDNIFGTMFAAPQHTYQILTKRPKRMAEYIPHLDDNCFECGDPICWSQKPNKNIWLGVTVCNPDEKPKIDVLRDIPAAVRFISFEPLLSDMGELNLDGISWVIVGCESGPKRRPCRIPWIESIEQQCKAANVPLFVKQIDIDGHVMKMPRMYPQQYPKEPK